MNAHQRRVKDRRQAAELRDRKALNRFSRDHADDPDARAEIEAMHAEVEQKWGRA